MDIGFDKSGPTLSNMLRGRYNLFLRLNVRNKATFDNFYSRLRSGGFELCSRRTGKQALDFLQDPKKSDRVEYLYDDGVGRGSALYRNLHRVLKVR